MLQVNHGINYKIVSYANDEGEVFDIFMESDGGNNNTSNNVNNNNNNNNNNLTGRQVKV